MSCSYTWFLCIIPDGVLQFNKTCEGEDPRDKRSVHFVFDDGTISDGIPSPQHDDDSSMSDISSPPVIPPAPEIPTSLKLKNILPVTTSSFTVTTNGSSCINTFSTTSSKSGSSSNVNNKSRPKKTKPKTQSKSKVIKFHEYKGPPNVVKSSPAAALAAAQNNGETPYHILLQQQQLFLQWPLEFQQQNVGVPVPLFAVLGSSTVRAYPERSVDGPPLLM
jgi:hypothetical protein